MSYFELRSKGEPRYTVRVAKCSREHAESVLRTVNAASGCPSDLVLYEVDNFTGKRIRKMFRRSRG